MTPTPTATDTAIPPTATEAPIATSTLAPSITPTSTQTPKLTEMPTPSSLKLEKPQCKRVIKLFDLSPKPLEIVDNVVGDIGCVSYFDLYEPKPGRLDAEMSLVINADATRAQVLQIVYDINKNLFTSDLGVTCVQIFVCPPGQETISGVNQSLGSQLAQNFSSRWDKASAQEWWSWLAENETPFYEVSADCEKDHWAHWDDRPEFAPWK
jgi:hypothetical protein